MDSVATWVNIQREGISGKAFSMLGHPSKIILMGGEHLEKLSDGREMPFPMIVALGCQPETVGPILSIHHFPRPDIVGHGLRQWVGCSVQHTTLINIV